MIVPTLNQRIDQQDYCQDKKEDKQETSSKKRKKGNIGRVEKCNKKQYYNKESMSLAVGSAAFPSAGVSLIGGSVSGPNRFRLPGISPLKHPPH